MKKGPFKMKGYSYPGTSPLKGARRRRREQLQKNRENVEDMFDEAFESDIERSTDLMASEGFTVDAKAPPTPDTLAKNPVPRRSPAKDATGEIVGQTLKDVIVESAITAGIEGGVALGVEALKPKDRKGHQGPDLSGFSKLKFGRD